jgi:hypothetical protein
VPYSLLVHAYSDVSLRATLAQSGYEPGATVTLAATLATSGVPPSPGTAVWAEITRPDSSSTTVAMTEGEPGRFGGSFTASMAGVYRCQVRGSGRSPAGYPFQREQSLTAAVWAGGGRDADPDTRSGGPLVRWARERDERLCRLLECLLSGRALLAPELQEGLRRAGVDAVALRRCLKEYCETRPTERELEELG